MEIRSVFLSALVALFCVATAAQAEVSVVIRNASGSQLSQAGCTLQGTGLETTGSTVQLTVNDSCIGTPCTPAYVVSPSSLSLGLGASKTFTVKLACTPSAAVTVLAGSQNTSIATVSPSSQSFTDTAEKTFTVTGSSSTAGTTTISLDGSSFYASGNVSDVAVTVNPNNCTDPLTSPWVLDASCIPTPPGEAVTIKAGVENGTTYAPGDTRFTGTFTDNVVWGIRHHFSTGADLYNVTVDRPEGGEDTATYDVALSRIPGSFTQTEDASGATITIPSICTATNQVTKKIYAKRRDLAGTGYCALDAGEYYYFNIRVNGTQNCGVAGKQCRIQSYSNIPH